MNKLTNRKGSNSIVLVDVGALGGVNKKWEKVSYEAILFEPNPTAKFENRNNWLVIRSALSDISEEKEFHITRKSSNSSFYKPNAELIDMFSKPERYDVIEKINLQTDTLDNQLKVNGINDIDYIKLDVQGYELPILKGGEAALKKAVAVELEVEFSPIYKHQPTFADVDVYLKSKGFELSNFLHLETWKYGDRENLIWGDAFYIKNLESLDASKREKLLQIKSIVLSKAMFGERFSRRKAKVIGKFKEYLKIILVWFGLRNPAKGVKVGAREKASTLLQYKTSDIKILVETGTNEGWMLDALEKHFDRAYSIELDEVLFLKAKKHFETNKKITLLKGDSAEEIKKVLEDINEGALFWLDAHGSGKINYNNAPVIKELEAIFAHQVKNHSILIDDARHFNYKTIRKMKKMAISNNYTFKIENGIFRLHGNS